MIDATAFAELICDYCLQVQAGDHVLIGTTVLAEPAVLELQAAIMGRDAWPIIRLALPDQEVRWLTDAHDVHLDSYSRAEASDIQLADRYLGIQAPSDPAAFSSIDPIRKARRDAARGALGKARMGKRWCGTLWPTSGLATFAGMELDEFERFVNKAMFLDSDDPVAAWGGLCDRQAVLIERLASVDQIKLEGDGTDLTLDVSDRLWINSDGKRNMPSGEVFTGPIEDSAKGTIRFSLPSAHLGTKVEGVTMRFIDGVVVEASAEVGQDHLDAMLEADLGARRLGEIGIGTNFGIDRPISNILFDEKIGGTVHLALGRSYPETLGRNESVIHWDLICDLRSQGRILLDGEPLDVRSFMD